MFDDELLKYLKEATARLQELDDEAEIDTLVGNVLEELGDDLPAACSDPVASRIMEKFLRHLPATRLDEFVAGLGDEGVVGMSTDRFGSHVLEKVLDAAAWHGAARMETSLRRMVAAVCSRLEEVIPHPSGSHVARKLVSCCAGRDLQKEAAAAKTSARPPAATRPPQLPGPLLDLAKAIVALINDQPMQWTEDMALHVYVSPFLQLLLRALQTEPGVLLLMTPLLLGASPFDAETGELRGAGELLAGVDEAFPKFVMEHRTGSHFVEALLGTCPTEVHEEFVARFMAGRWEPLSAHPTANFAVQAAIATARTPQQVEGMAAELCDHFPALMRGSRAGVVAALVAGSQRHAAACKQVAKALSSATMELGRLSSSSEMVPWMLFMGHKGPVASVAETLGEMPKGERHKGKKKKKDSEKRGADYRPPRRKLSVLGCAILCSVLRFPSKRCKKWLESFVSLNKDDLLAMAADAGGCRVIEAFLEGEAGEEAKAGVLAALRGRLSYFVKLGPGGSKFVERCYQLSSVDGKEAIARELLDDEAAVRRLKWGAILLAHCDVYGLQRSEKQWREKASRVDAVAAEFEEVFGAKHGDAEDAGEEPGAAQNGSHNKRKKAKGNATKDGGEGGDGADARARALGGAAVDDIMRLLGAGGDAGEVPVERTVAGASGKATEGVDDDMADLVAGLTAQGGGGAGGGEGKKKNKKRRRQEEAAAKEQRKEKSKDKKSKKKKS